MNRTALGALVLAGLLVAGVAVPAMALSTGTAEPSASDSQGPSATGAAQQDNASVNVSVGPQLSTVIGASSDEVQTDVDNTAFELSVEGASDEATAEAIAERADQLRDRAAAIREEYEAATAAFEAGELTRSEYAQRIAALNARASSLLTSYEQLEQRAATVSALELRAAGVSESALDRPAANLSSVTGAGARALLERFTGESEGEIELDTGDGLSIEVESEDGERSRELERPRDGDDSLTTSQSAALDTAREALSTPGGRWVLTGSQVAEGDGAYVFAFALRNDAGLTGEAEVSVDGSTGELFALEEEIEPRVSEDSEEDDRDRELAMVVAEGTPAPDATVTVQVLADGEPAEGATVSLDDRAVGTTGADGRVTVTLPTAEEVELTARSGDAEGDLEFEFDGEGTDEVLEKLVVDASLDGDTVTATVSYDGDGVEGASVSANGRAVGTTGPDGTVTFTVDASATEELELDVVKGAFEAELAYTVQDGSLTPVEEEYERESGDDPADDESEDEREEEADDEDEDGDEADPDEEREQETDDEDEPDDTEEDDD